MRCLQLASPSLPIGAYAYSQGLEMAVEPGWVTNAEQLEGWLRDQIEQSMAQVDMPLLARLYDAAACHDQAALKHWSTQLIAQSRRANCAPTMALAVWHWRGCCAISALL